MSNIYLSVIVPAYREEKRIRSTLLDLERYFREKQYRYEIIVVNDGSPDGTADVVRELIPQIPNLSVIDNKKNRGKGFAVKCGMTYARGQYRLFMDADNSVRIDELDTFIADMERNGHDIAIGSIAFSYARTVEHNGWHRRFLGSLSKMMVRVIAVPGIYDTQRGFKVFTARAAEMVFPRQRIRRFGFDIEILLIALTHSLSVKELPVQWDNPPGSTVKLSSYFQSLSELGRIFMNKARGMYDPVYGPKTESLPLWRKIFREMTYVPRRLWREIFDSRMHLHVKIYNRGKSILFGGKEFVHHSGLHHSESALYNLVRAQKVVLGLIAAAFVVFLFVNWHATLVATISVITFLYFLDLLFNVYLSVRSISSNPEISVSETEIQTLRDIDLPRYTIFCPLYKEWQVVPQFVSAMSKLDSPAEKLEILFLLEENDTETIEKIRAESMPEHFKIVVVPHSNPKTKPKAMNYGLQHATGEYLVIYDAEDMPEPDQLKKAIVAFGKTSDRTICVQAKLNFYNTDQNILTKIFTAEYSLWFDLILPGLQSIDAPIPLGGTSNHFKVSVLKELDGWDAFNVTEDCDLGMRLAKRGYKTAVVESTTYEEANSEPINWYNQRSRWIKGYIQTYFVHMRAPQNFKGRIRDFLAFQIIVGGKIFSMFINPIFWLVTICYFAFRLQVGDFIESFFPGIILHIGVVSFVMGNFLYLYNYMIGCSKRGFDSLVKYIFLTPFYWLGMSLAAWKGVYEVIIKPHYWSKTVHGLHLKKQLNPTKI